MATNSLTNIFAKILSVGLMALREQAIMPRLVTSDYQGEAQQKGSTIDIPTPKTQTASDVTAAPVNASAAANTPALVQVSLDQWKHSDFYLTDKEMVEIDRNRHFIPMQTSEAIRSLANIMDINIHNNYTGIYGYVGTAGTAPFSAVSDATDTRKVLNEQLAPIANRNVVLDPTAEGKALQLAAFSDFEKTGDRSVKIEGELGRKFGMDWFMSQNVQTHTAGTAGAAITVGSTTAAGVSTLAIDASLAGTILLGDIFTIAGHTQTYVVTAASVDLSSVSANVTIDPALAQIATTGVAITLKASHTVNLAFHPNAFAFGTRPLINATSDVAGGNAMMSATDPISGLSLRLEVSRQFKQTSWDFDVLYGSKLVRPEYATRIAG